MISKRDNIYNIKQTSKFKEDVENIRLFAKNIVADKENEIKIASSFSNRIIVNSLRDELQKIRNKYSQFLDESPIEEIDPIQEPIAEEEDNFIDENDGDPVPTSEVELNDLLFNSIADSFTTVINENNEAVFNVNFSDPNTIIIEYDSNKGGLEKSPFIFQNLEQFMKPVLDDIIGKIGFGEENPEIKKQMMVDELKELMQMYRDSLSSKNIHSDTKEGKNTLIYKRSEDSLEIASQIYDILKKHGLAGPIADMDYGDIAKSDNADNQNMMGEPVMEAKKKSFNLKKKADKLFDNIREKAIQKLDPQYKSRHGIHALPWYEDAYIPEEDYKNNIMDKYYPEQLDADGEYRGGYINDRFTVHHNTEGNSMHVKPGTRTAPDRVESYSTERRLEEMRNNNERDYELSEGSETEQQTLEVKASSNNDIIVSEDNGVYKVVCGQKVTYLDTPEQLEAFQEIIKDLMANGYNIISDKETLKDKKKIAQLNNPSTLVPTMEESGVLDTNTQTNDASPDNPLLSIVNNLKSQYPNMQVERLIQEGIIQLMSSGMTTQEVERFRVETMRSFGMPVETKDYGQIDIDPEIKQQELGENMGE